MGYNFRFIHTADTHLGLNWPKIPSSKSIQISAYEKVFKFIIDKAIEEKVDFVLHAGDLVDNPTPNIPALRSCFFELRRLKENKIPFIITKGNHDSSNLYLERYGGDFLEILENEGRAVYVEFSRREHYDLKTRNAVVRIFGLGDYGFEQEKTLFEFSRLFKREEVDFTILLLHSELKDRAFPSESSLSTSHLKRLHGVIDYFALGHDHQHFEDKEISIYNPGSPEYCSFKEANTVVYSFSNGELKEIKQEVKEKGFYLVDVNDGEIDAKFIKTPTRKVLNVQVEFNNATPDDVLEGMSKALEINAKSQNAILRPVIKGKLSANYRVYDLKLREIKESVDALYVEWPLCLIEGITYSVLEITPQKNYLNLLQEYFKNKGWDEESSKMLAQFTLGIIKTLNIKTEKILEEPEKSVLKMIEELDLNKLRKI